MFIQFVYNRAVHLTDPAIQEQHGKAGAAEALSSSELGQCGEWGLKAWLAGADEVDSMRELSWL